MSDAVTLDELRQRLNDLDRQLIELAAERKAVSEEVARVKRSTGRPTRDYEREKDVILGVRTVAAERGLSPELAEQLLRLLIRSSLATQEHASVVAHGAGSARGAAGRGLAPHRPQARLHRARNAARHHRRDPQGPGAAPSAGGDLRRRLAQVAAARRAPGTQVPRLQGDLGAPHVR